MYDVMQRMKSAYPNENPRLIQSPLRICPLGAHVDHQQGLVTGMALEASVDFCYLPNQDGSIRIQSLDFPDEEYFHVDHVPDMLPGYWGNYVRGAILALSRNYIIKYGFTGMISGKLPIGGLSSSAAVTTAYLMAICDVNEINISKEELVQNSHWVENHFIGLKNGILDQAANILSKKQHLMFMDCKTGKYDVIQQSANMTDFEVVIVYSGISKSLISTDYNQRVDECKVAAWLLQEILGQEVSGFDEVSLSDIDYDSYQGCKNLLPGRFRRRAEHFFTENERVKQGVNAWLAGDLITFGQLMSESGKSSIVNYECGSPELITIFHLLKECPGVYGARFSGAGYRGCCIGLIDPRYKDEVAALIDSEYPVRHPKYKDNYKVHFCKTHDGSGYV